MACGIGKWDPSSPLELVAVHLFAVDAPDVSDKPLNSYQR